MCNPRYGSSETTVTEFGSTVNASCHRQVDRFVKTLSRSWTIQNGSVREQGRSIGCYRTTPVSGSFRETLRRIVPFRYRLLQPHRGPGSAMMPKLFPKNRVLRINQCVRWKNATIRRGSQSSNMPLTAETGVEVT
jgi:hypothetical protein